ncbi:MAG: DUF4224 domain-containing protein [Betaproteobacteria bacterium]|jgi:hypothetical protein
MNDPAILTPAELHAITGYEQPSRQLEVLRAAGFWRARIRERDNVLVLERPHFEAVCAGALPPHIAPGPLLSPGPRKRPRLDAATI